MHGFTITDLTVDHATAPLGLTNLAPRFGWRVNATGGWFQLSWRVRVATRPELLTNRPDLWDSGIVTSGDMTSTPYAGAALASRNTCFWDVELCATDERASRSAPASWEVGVLQASDLADNAATSAVPFRPCRGQPTQVLRPQRLIEKQ